MLQLVSPDGRSLSLSGREFLLIEQFVGKHDHILSRQTLSQTLGYGTHGSVENSRWPAWRFRSRHSTIGESSSAARWF